MMSCKCIIDPNKTEDGLKRKLDIKNQSNVVKKSKFTEINTSVNAVKNARFIYDSTVYWLMRTVGQMSTHFSLSHATQNSNHYVARCLICLQLLNPVVFLEYHSE